MTHVLEITPYDPNKPNELLLAKTQLEEEGFTVLSPILSTTQLGELEQQFWDTMLLHNPNINRYDRSTWTNKTFPGDFSTGILSYYGMTQSDYLWSIRCHETPKHIFANFHNCATDQLCVSMDAANCMFSSRNKKKSWLHRDQAPWLPMGDKYSLQGIFSHYPVGPNDAGFICCPKSHLETIPISNSKHHFLPIAMDDAHHDQSVKLLIPGNSLIVYNSKLLHCNKSATIDRPNMDNQPVLNRLAAYVSYWPKLDRTADILEQKQRLYLLGQGTSHWGILARKKMNQPRWPRSKKSDPINIISPTLTKDGNIPPERAALF
jgi:hypothetical protein